MRLGPMSLTTQTSRVPASWTSGSSPGAPLRLAQCHIRLLNALRAMALYAPPSSPFASAPSTGAAVRQLSFKFSQKFHAVTTAMATAFAT